MKVFYIGLNLYHQLIGSRSTIKRFTEFSIDRQIENIEVSYTYSVLLVADGILLKGHQNEKIDITEKVVQVCCNEDFILVLTQNGTLHRTLKNPIKLIKLHVANLDQNEWISKINCGSKLTIALTNTGRLYNLPNKLEFRNKDIIDIKVGRLHCLLLDRDGNVYSFGSGSHGQLGHGSLEDNVEPKLIEALAGIRIMSIAAGGWHSAAVSKDGDVYVWGWNSNGQLGLSSKDDATISVMATPKAVDFDLNIKLIACGNRHTIVLLENGQIYGCGWNRFCQLLDNGKEENLHSLTFLNDFSKEDVIELKCGPWSSLVICNE